uniref:G-protein coupled receptors family 2 profile 2 domain-containing protein n=1 Tax=Glossina morsitans morsitans TaxID=37546 RepID=A0A1B0GFQ1_GLOMM
GLYLYMLVVKTFSSDNIRFNIYVLIGWGKMGCPWMHETHVDWIFQGPVCAVLLINLIFLLIIMWVVLITKLRSANTVETRQYRKAAKALLVLIPLFGITYLVVLAGPNEGGIMSHMFAILRSVLLSTQVSCNLCHVNNIINKTN